MSRTPRPAKQAKPAGWARASLSARTLTAAAAIGTLAELIIALDALTDRDLKKYPPQDNETMAQIGLDGSALIRLRKYVNIRFRRPRGQRDVTALQLNGATTFAQLKALCGL